MDTADSQHLSRLSKLLLAGTGVAFAWVFLSLALGLSASDAHAEDEGGLLGGVTSAVDETATAVTDVVDDTATTAVQTIAPVVQPVAATVAPLPVAPVVETLVHTVAEVPAGGLISPIADTAVDVVHTVPVVGGVATALGVDDAVSSAGTSVDGLLQGTTGAVAGTVTDVVDTAGGIVTGPGGPPLGGLHDALTGAASTAGTDAAANPVETLARAAFLAGATAWLSLTSDLPAAISSSDGASASTWAVAGILSLIRSVVQADSFLIGPGGAGPGAWVLVALGLVVAHRAWVRRTGLENDVAPPAPVMATDVSPD